MRQNYKSLIAGMLAILTMATLPIDGQATQESGPVEPADYFKSAFDSILKAANLSPEPVGLTPLFCTSDSTQDSVGWCSTDWLYFADGDGRESADYKTNYQARGDFFTGVKLDSPQFRLKLNHTYIATSELRPGGTIELVGQNGKLIGGDMRVVVRIREITTPESPENWKSMNAAQIAQSYALQKAFLETVVQCEDPILRQVMTAKILNEWPLSFDHMKNGSEKPKEIIASCGLTTVTRRPFLYDEKRAQGVGESLHVALNPYWEFKWLEPVRNGAKECPEHMFPFCSLTKRYLFP